MTTNSKDWQPTYLSAFARLAGPLWQSGGNGRIRALTVVLIVLTILQVVINVVITEWSAKLFDALEQHSMQRLLTLIGFLFLIIVANMSITVGHLLTKRRIQVIWRTWLTDNLLGHWMRNGRHYQVNYLPGKHDNPDGRIAEDIRIATEYAIDLSHSLFYCVLLLLGFGRVLWRLSGVITVPLGPYEIPVYGHLVWIAMLYAAAAATLGWAVGRSLIRATNSRQSAEANFRFGLVRARENAEGIALVRGESEERRRLLDLFRGIAVVWQQQTYAFGRITLFSSAYTVVNTGFPILISAPRYILGSITLGSLVQSAQAFQQFASALSWPVDNLAKMAEWRASVERVLDLHDSLCAIDQDVMRGNSGTIHVEATDQPALLFRNLCIANPDGEELSAPFSATVHASEKVLIAGDTGVAGKLFKVIAKLWPWGSGQVETPAGITLYFMPPRPYMPIGRLRDAFSYPSPPDTFGVEAVEQILVQVGLGHLVHKLDASANWEQTLSLNERQRLSAASMLLHRPKWVLMQESLDSIDADGQREILDLFTEHLPNASLISVSHQRAVQAFHTRTITLELTESGRRPAKETKAPDLTERRGHTEISWHQHLLGILRRDRRQHRDG